MEGECLATVEITNNKSFWLHVSPLDQPSGVTSTPLNDFAIHSLIPPHEKAIFAVDLPKQYVSFNYIVDPTTADAESLTTAELLLEFFSLIPEAKIAETQKIVFDSLLELGRTGALRSISSELDAVPSCVTFFTYQSFPLAQINDTIRANAAAAGSECVSLAGPAIVGWVSQSLSDLPTAMKGLLLAGCSNLLFTGNVALAAVAISCSLYSIYDLQSRIQDFEQATSHNPSSQTLSLYHGVAPSPTTLPPTTTSSSVTPISPPPVGTSCTTPPTLSSPLNGSSTPSTQDVTLRWSTSCPSSYAELSGAPYSTMSFGGWQSQTSVHIGPMWPGTYTWHVKTRDASGKESGWSASWTFTVTATSSPSPTSSPNVPVPTLSAPADGTSLQPNQSQTFTWSNTGASSYKFEAWNDDGPGSVSQVVSGTSYTFAPGNVGHWRWQVHSIQANGQDGDAPHTFSFVVGTPAGVRLWSQSNYQGESRVYSYVSNDTCMPLGSMSDQSKSLSFEGGYFGNYQAIFYADDSCQTFNARYDKNVSDFGLLNNQFSSMRMERIEGVQLCTGEGATGTCQTYTVGAHDTLEGLDGSQVKSLRDPGAKYHVTIYENPGRQGGLAHYDDSVDKLPAPWYNHTGSINVEVHRPTGCNLGSDGVALYQGPDYNRGGGACLFITSDVPDLQALNYDNNLGSVDFVGGFLNHKQITIYRQKNYQDPCGTYFQPQNLPDCGHSALSIQITDYAAPTPVPTQPGTAFSGDVAPDAYIYPEGAGAIVDGSLNTRWQDQSPLDSTVHFSWAAPVTIDRAVVWDQMSPGLPVTEKVALAFSDGTISDPIDMNSLGNQCADIAFAPKTVTWVEVIPWGGGTGHGFREIELWATTGVQQSNNVCVNHASAATHAQTVSPPPVLATAYPTQTTTQAAGNDLVVSADASKSTDGQAHDASNPYLIPVGATYGNVTIESGAYASAPGWTGSSGGTLSFSATGRVQIDGVLTMDGRGYRGGGSVVGSSNGIQGESYGGPGVISEQPNGGGGGGAPDDRGQGAGGGYGSAGADATTYFGRAVHGGQPYGDPALSTIFLGSGGGSSGANSARLGAAGGGGGGAISISAGSIVVTGRVSANGADGQSVNIDPGAIQGGGGGSGGSILLSADSIDLSQGSVSALGGQGGSGVYNGQSVNGGNGGVGRIWLQASAPVNGTTNPPAGFAQTTPPTQAPTEIPTLAPTTVATVQASSQTVSVPAGQPWTDTGIDVPAGAHLQISASGIIKIAGSDPGKGPSGGPPCLAADGWVAPGLVCWSLIGRVAGGTPFAVGDGVDLIAPAAGRLELGVNDDSATFSDNSGAWTAVVVVDPSGVVPTFTPAPMPPTEVPTLAPTEVPTLVPTEIPTATPTPFTDGAEATVAPNAGWVDTGIQVPAQPAAIGFTWQWRAWGAVQPASGQGLGPDGDLSCAADASAPAPGLPCGALIGRYGPDGVPFFIGSIGVSGDTDPLPAPATLQLAVNLPAGSAGDDAGAFTLNVRFVATGAPPTEAPTDTPTEAATDTPTPESATETPTNAASPSTTGPGAAPAVENVDASSRLSHDPALATDGNPATAWIEGAPGSGVGESITIAFTSVVHLNSLTIVNGVGAGDQAYAAYGAIAQLEVAGSAGGDQVLTLEHIATPQTFAVDLTGSQFTFTIRDVYPGTVFPDETALGEVSWSAETVNPDTVNGAGLNAATPMAEEPTAASSPSSGTVASPVVNAFAASSPAAVETPSPASAATDTPTEPAAATSTATPTLAPTDTATSAPTNTPTSVPANTPTPAKPAVVAGKATRTPRPTSTPRPTATPRAGIVEITRRDAHGSRIGGSCYQLNGDQGSYGPVCDNASGDASTTKGLIRIIDVAPGSYTLTETTPPKGLDAAAPQSVAVTAGRRARVTIQAPKATPTPTEEVAAIQPAGGSEVIADTPTTAPDAVAPTATETEVSAAPASPSAETAATGHLRVMIIACPSGSETPIFSTAPLDAAIDAFTCTGAANVTVTLTGPDGSQTSASAGSQFDLPVGHYGVTEDASGATFAFDLPADGMVLIVQMPAASSNGGIASSTGDTTEATATPTEVVNPSLAANGATPIAANALSGHLAYALKVNGHWDLYVADLLSGQSTQLTNMPDRDEWAPAWSHDGGQLAYLSDAGDGSNQVWLMAADGSNPRQVTHWTGDPIAYVAWSADDQNLILTVGSGDQAQLMTVAVAGGDPQTFVPAPASDASIAANGEMVYSTVQNGNLDLVAVGPDGATTTIAGSPEDEDAANLSPDGAKVAYQVGQAPNRRVETVAISGGTPAQLQTPPGDASDPVWSPDAATIAVVIDDGQGQHLWLVGLDGSQTELPLAPHDKVWYLAWSPT